MGRYQVAAARADEGSREGYRELYRAYHPRVQRLSRLLLRDADEAQDVTQEVFVAAYREWARSDRPMLWGAWLTRVTVNACRQRRRSRWWRWRTSEPGPLTEADFPSPRATPEKEAIGEETRRRIQSVYAKLPPRQREVFVLRHVEEWTSHEVALALGLSDGAVKRHLFRATQAFRKALGERS